MQFVDNGENMKVKSFNKMLQSEYDLFEQDAMYYGDNKSEYFYKNGFDDGLYTFCLMLKENGMSPKKILKMIEKLDPKAQSLTYTCVMDWAYDDYEE